jgi:hydrophobe/amphiphile efflux-1 (HAE1) family protein
MTEVTPAGIAIALGLAAGFIPVAFISGITGQVYRQFAQAIAVSTLISAFNSLTLSPAMAALLLKSSHERMDWFGRVMDVTLGWFFRGFNAGLARFTAGYAAVLRRVVRFGVVVLLLYVGLLFLTYLGFRTVPTGFIPPQDKGYLVASLQLPDAASTERTDAVIRHMAEIAKATPGVEDTFAIAGYSFLSSTNQSNAGAMFVTLRPFEERVNHPEMSSQAIMGALMGQYSQIQEGFALVFPPPPVTGMGFAGGFKMQVQDRAGRGTPQELQDATDKLIAAARQSPDVEGRSLLTTFRANVPQLYVDVDRAKAKSQGVSMTSLFDTLQIYLGSLYVNDFNFLGRTYQVVAQAEPQFRATAEDIRQLQTRNERGDMVPLGSLMAIEDTTGPVRINRYNLFRSAEINGQAAPGVSTGQVTDTMERLARENLPAGYGFEWTELTFQEKLAGNSAVWIFPLCVLFVWLTHSAEYESFATSTAIILIVPMCLLFGIAGVWLRGMDNNIFTQIGFVVLAGLSAKNAVLIVEFAKQQQEHGLNRFDAAIEAARLRLRPILMTSFAFILGVVPMVIATGAGAEMRQAIGTAVFFGMLGVTFFGIFLTPVFYVSIRWIVEGGWRRGRGKPGRGRREVVAAVPVHAGGDANGRGDGNGNGAS